MRSPDQIAEDLIRAVTTGDVDLVAELYADDAVLWQNTTAKTTDKARTLKVVQWLVNSTTDLHYTDIRRTSWDNGFVQEHTMRGKVAANGNDLVVHACLVVTVCNGQMVEVREYMDSRAQDVFSS